jgi:hypothetical protein
LLAGSNRPAKGQVLINRDIATIHWIELLKPIREFVCVFDHPLDRARRNNGTAEFL